MTRPTHPAAELFPLLDGDETMYPDLPKLELFARGAPRPGWDAWGNEVAA